ncbi:MAG TPA: GAF domain-containing protein [Gemmatimonadaceae bacterium]|nr:GAF domain-containing protein [Gemmatimonadaceae bacterium]
MTSSAPHPYFATRSSSLDVDAHPSGRFAALADQVAESETLTQIARQIAGAGSDRGAAFDLLANGAVSLVGADGAVVALLTDDSAQIRVESAAGALTPMLGFTAPLAGSLAAESLACFHPLVLNDAAGDSRVDAHFLSPFSPRQVVVAPMVVAESPRGFLLALNSPKGYFSPADGALMQRLADHGAIAVRHAELIARTEAAAKEASSLADIVQQINQSLELERVVNLLARHAAGLLGARGARVGVLDSELTHLITSATFGDATDRIGSVFDTSAVFAGEAIRLRRAVTTTDLRPYADQWARTGRGASVGAGRANGVTAPLMVGGRIIGAVTVFGRENGEFNEHDGAILQALGNHAAVAIENARLYRAAAYTARHASILATTGRALAYSTSPDDVYRGIAEVASEALGANGFTVTLANPETRHVERAHAYGPGTGGMQLTPEQYWRTPNGKAVETGQPFYASDIDEIPMDWAPPGYDLERFAMRSVAVLPLIAEGKPRGVLSVRFPTRHKFEEHERRVLEDFATQVAVAVRNAQLAEQERMLAVALATMENPVFVLTADGHIRYSNPAAAVEYGYSVNELTGLAFDQLIAEGATDVHRRANGSEFPAVVTSAQILDTGGQVVSVRNTTEEKRIAEALLQTEKLAAIGELVAGVAHELNNPLTGISTFAQLLLEEKLGEEQLDAVRNIKRESDRAVSVIRDLLVFSRKSDPRYGQVDLRSLIEQTLRLRSYTLQSAGITVEKDLDPNLPTVMGDDRKLQQVLMNVIVNAEYAMHRTDIRRLQVRATGGHSYVAVEIADTGVGMTPDIAKHVFEPFFTTKPVGVGTGLGMSVSYGIVKAHGGSIDVSSTSGLGTTFRIALPLTPAAPPPE